MPGPPAQAFAFLGVGRSLPSSSATFGVIALSGGTTTASVAQAPSQAGCTDQFRAGILELFIGADGHGHLTVGFAPPAPLSNLGSSGFAGSSDVFDDRCAGPRMPDLLKPSAFPISTYGGTYFRGKTVEVGLVGTKPFSAAGFTGTVTTDLHISLQRVRLRNLGTIGTSPSPGPTG